jgi:hypothetical protein
MNNWASTVSQQQNNTKSDADELLASLTASFNRNHISQEAVDLDTLQVYLSLVSFLHPTHSHQAQLKQALDHATAQGRLPSHHPNTPTQTSATLHNGGNPDWSKFRAQRGTRSKATSFSMGPGEPEDLMMIEEEKEVEGLLEHHMHQAPPSVPIPIHPCQQSHFTHQYPSHVSPSTSFAATDPFFAMSAQPPQSRHYVAPQTAFFNQQQN